MEFETKLIVLFVLVISLPILRKIGNEVNERIEWGKYWEKKIDRWNEEKEV